MFSIKKCAPSSEFKAKEWRRGAVTFKVRVIYGKFFVILCADDGIFFLNNTFLEWILTEVIKVEIK